MGQALKLMFAILRNDPDKWLSGQADNTLKLTLDQQYQLNLLEQSRWTIDSCSFIKPFEVRIQYT